jgi:hypothetical protein
MSRPLPDRVVHLESILPRLESIVEKSVLQTTDLSRIVQELAFTARSAHERMDKFETLIGTVHNAQVANATTLEQLSQTRQMVAGLRNEMDNMRRSQESLARKWVYAATMLTVLGGAGSYLLNSVSFYPKNPPPAVIRSTGAP